MMMTIPAEARVGPLRKAACVAFCMFFGVTTLAAPFSSDGVTINIPAGFEGPEVQKNSGARQFNFTKQSSMPAVRTLLQITISSPRNEELPEKLSKQELAQRSEKYANDLMKVFEGIRADFARGNVVHLQMGGIPASKVTWKGKLDDIAANGVMYCVIVNGTLMTMHTQDIGNEPTPNMRAAMKAFETLKVKAPPATKQ